MIPQIQILFFDDNTFISTSFVKTNKNKITRHQPLIDVVLASYCPIQKSTIKISKVRNVRANK